MFSCKMLLFRVVSALTILNVIAEILRVTDETSDPLKIWEELFTQGRNHFLGVVEEETGLREIKTAR
jgi:hypothetical protein